MKVAVFAAILACAIAVGPLVPSAMCSPSEYEVKSAFIFNFVKFVEWPSEAFSDSKAPVIIGVLGEDPFGSALDNAVANKSVNGRKIEIRRFKKTSDLKPAHILFISSSEDHHLSKIFEALKDKPVLTVGETDNCGRAGGTVRFYSAENKIKFAIYVDRAKKIGLKISSKLLRLAKTIRN